MRFNHVDFCNIKTGPYTSEEAVARQLDQEAALCDGQMERMQARIEALQGIISRLIDVVPQTSQSYKAHCELMANVIGYCWEPEEGK